MSVPAAPLIVTPLSALVETCDKRRPSHVVSLLSPGTALPTIPGVTFERRMMLPFHDIGQPAEGLVAPTAAMVVSLLDFADQWDRTAPLVIHCWAGISRSPAAALILACARSPQTPEAELAKRLRQVAPFATPNPLLIALADAALARDGRLIAAVENIGRGEEACEGKPFDL